MLIITQSTVQVAQLIYITIQQASNVKLWQQGHLICSSQQFGQVVLYNIVCQDLVSFLCGMETVPKHIFGNIFTHRSRGVAQFCHFNFSSATAPSVYYFKSYNIKIPQELKTCIEKVVCKRKDLDDKYSSYDDGYSIISVLYLQKLESCGLITLGVMAWQYNKRDFSMDKSRGI